MPCYLIMTKFHSEGRKAHLKGLEEKKLEALAYLVPFSGFRYAFEYLKIKLRFKQLKKRIDHKSYLK